MKTRIKAIERIQPGVVGGGERKYYATIVRGEPVELRDFMNAVAKLSTVNTPDVYAVMESLFQLIPDYLLEGRTIQFGHLGYFYLAISSNPEETPQEVSDRSVRSSRLVFRPSKKMNKFTRNLEFTVQRNPILEPEGPPGDEPDEPVDQAA